MAVEDSIYKVKNNGNDDYSFYTKVFSICNFLLGLIQMILDLVEIVTINIMRKWKSNKYETKLDKVVAITKSLAMRYY